MAKMTRSQRAWKLFVDAFTNAGSSRKGFGHRTSAEHYEKQYRKLIKLAKEFGIDVFKKSDLGVSKDAQGKEFTVGGQWAANGLKRPRIELTVRSISVLAHEFAHAMDQLKRVGFRIRREDELMACAVGYMISCEILGIRNPRSDVEYAKRQGATEELLWKMQDEILDLFSDIMEMLNSEKEGGRA
jgi:hypothetical protein